MQDWRRETLHDVLYSGRQSFQYGPLTPRFSWCGGLAARQSSGGYACPFQGLGFKVISLIDKTLKWPLMSGSKLPTWIAPSKKLLILGDAAHAMLPYMSQGAAMAVEDAAAIAEALSLAGSRKDVSKALGVFEKERMKRAGDMQTASLLNGVIWHFADGPVQRARDASMRAEIEGRVIVESANQWSDPATQLWCYGYDAEAAIRDAWRAFHQDNGSNGAVAH
ncbi:Monooxygenase FAD-binding protein [Macrophomina phaseolina MS6]|uniref:Monooxygenase FAD-binding protein n=1 Tax=Macrophomina phaseolina (strain MS6) TaxID=1126212 RepID=K2RU98_MACPH|nr:Monooxygenase FAD-binding protein [Macrophomina phaseolina MS6]